MSEVWESRKGDNWDELYPRILRDLVKNGERRQSRTVEVKELLGYEMVLENPRTRCLQNEEKMFNVFQALGHWLWVMSGRMDLSFIEYYNKSAPRYSTDSFRLHGAYGPRLAGIGVYNQIQKSVSIINQSTNTRRALAPIFVPSHEQASMRHDDEHKDEIPCPVALHFLPRDGSLHQLTYMRSQNAYTLLPLDVFTLTMIQEYVAASASLEIGSYRHYSGSFHYHTSDEEDIETIIGKASDSSGKRMPAMPQDNPQGHLSDVLDLEERIRSQVRQTDEFDEEFLYESYLAQIDELPKFWSLVGELLLLWGLSQLGMVDGMRDISEQIDSSMEVFIDRAIQKTRRRS